MGVEQNRGSNVFLMINRGYQPGLPPDDKGLYYKDEPYTTKRLHQRLIITYSPKYARYQRTLRDSQVERAQKMLDSGNTKKNAVTQTIRQVLSGPWQ